MEQRRAEGVLKSEGEREEFDVFGVNCKPPHTPNYPLIPIVMDCNGHDRIHSP